MSRRAALCSLLLLTACGAQKPRRVIKPAAPPSAAVADAPKWTELPNPAAETIEVIDADEAARGANGPFFAGATDLFTLEQNHRASLSVTGPAERAQHAFWISRATGETATHRHVHCATARVFEVKNTAAPSRDARVADQWVLRVALDAPGEARPRAVAMTWYRHIVKHHELAYIGRSDDGLALYEYVRPRPIPEGS